MTSDQRLVTDDQRLVTVYCLLFAGYQLPTTNYQLPTTNYLLPTTYYLLPTTNYLLPVTSRPSFVTIFALVTILRKYSYEYALLRARQYCDKGERAHWDVRNLLTKWGLPYHEREQIIVALIEQDLLNESRYASAFVNDKFRFNKWGVKKIEQALKAKGVSTRNISDALKRIDPEEYHKSVEEIIQKRLEREAKLLSLIHI